MSSPAPDATAEPVITYPAELPVSQRRDDIAEAIRDHQVVIVGDDRALLRAVSALHLRGQLQTSPLAVVPVGPPAAVTLASALGVPTDAVAASRAVLSGTDRRLDLLTDDTG